MYEVFHSVEEDAHVHATLSKRKLAVTGRQMQITPSVEEKEGVEQSKRERAIVASDMCNTLVFGSDGEPGIAEFQQAQLDVADGIGRGFSITQIVWKRDQRRDLIAVPAFLHYWPQSRCWIGPYANEEDIPPDHIRLNPESDGNLEELKDWQWIVHKHKVRSDVLYRAALLRIVAWWYLFKHFSVADWGIFLERYGLPFRKGTYGPGAQDEEKKELKKAIINFGKDGGAVLPDSTNIEMIESVIRGEVPHAKHIDMCNAEISKAILGQTMTTEAPDRGARSLGEVQKGEQSLFAEDDARRIAESYRRYLMTPIVRFNLGDDYPVPYVTLATQESIDRGALADRHVKLAGMGLKIPVSHLYETHEIPPPQDDEPTVGGRAPAPTTGQQPEDQSSPTEDEIEDAEQEANANGVRYAVVTRQCAGRKFAWAGDRWIALADDGSKKKSLDWAIPLR